MKQKLWRLRQTSFLQISTIGLFSAFEAVHMKDNGISEVLFGSIMAINTCITIFISPVWGMIADKTGKYKELIIFACLVLSANLFYFALADTAEEFIVYSIIRGITFPIIMGLMPPFAQSNLREMGDGKSFGSYRSFGSIGFITGTFLFPLIFKDIRSCAIAGGVLLPLAILRIRALDNPAMKKTKRQSSFKWLKAPPALYLFYLSFFFVYTTDPGIHSFLGAYARSMGAGIQWVGTLAAITGLLAFFSLPLLGNAADRSGPRLILLLAFSATVLRMLTTSYISQPYLLWLPHLFHFLAWAGREVSSIVFLKKLVGKENLATALSVAISVRMAGFSLGNMMMGYLAEYFGYPAMFRLAALAAFCGLITAAFIDFKKVVK